EKVRIYLQLRKNHPEEASWIDTRIPLEFFELGYFDQAMIGWNLPLEFARDYRGDPTPQAILKNEIKDPLDFWLEDDTPMVFGRTLPKHGRLNEYVGYYRAAFKKTEDFFSTLPKGRLLAVTPNLVANLR